jgi:hypothetical protein
MASREILEEALGSIKPEAVRLPDGTELYVSHEEAMVPFTPPSEVEAFEKAAHAMGPFGLLSMFRIRRESMTSRPEHVPHREDQFSWIRYSDS